jgi:ParB family transcriptional regulator, chromosome partitioning protein
MIQITPINIDKLIPYVNNARTHSAEQVAQIAASIQEFGWTNPVLIDGKNGLIAGHGRLLAARKLGMTEIPSIQLDNLTETQKKALILADNKLALNASWDNELLAIELDDLKSLDYDLDLIGFTIEEMLAFNSPSFEPATEYEQGKLDQLDPKWIDCPHCGKEFDARQA